MLQPERTCTFVDNCQSSCMVTWLTCCASLLGSILMAMLIVQVPGILASWAQFPAGPDDYFQFPLCCDNREYMYYKLRHSWTAKKDTAIMNIFWSTWCFERNFVSNFLWGKQVRFVQSLETMWSTVSSVVQSWTTDWLRTTLKDHFKHWQQKFCCKQRMWIRIRIIVLP